MNACAPTGERFWNKRYYTVLRRQYGVPRFRLEALLNQCLMEAQKSSDIIIADFQADYVEVLGAWVICRRWEHIEAGSIKISGSEKRATILWGSKEKKYDESLLEFARYLAYSIDSGLSAVPEYRPEKVTTKPAQSRENIRRNKGGRPRNVDDDWAWHQVNVLCKPRPEVMNKWLERIGERADLLEDSRQSFNKAVKLSRIKENDRAEVHKRFEANIE